MARNGLIGEAASEQWPTGLPAPDDKVRLTPTVAAILDEARPAGGTKGQQLRMGAVKVALIADIVHEDFDRAHDRLGKLTGRSIPNGVCLRCGAPGVVEGTPAGKSVPERDARTPGSRLTGGC